MEKYRKLILGILKELMIIPAPSGHEDKRAEYCLEKLREFGFENAYVDNAKNVIVEWGEGEETVIYAAHTDVVFPDTDVLPYTEDKKYIRCPGCGDDTVAVSMLMVSMKKLIEENKKPTKKIIFVLNACEEGLGNLKGTREVVERYGKSIKEFYTFDGCYNHVVDKSVGSHRYEVTVKTEGGHSFGDFGNLNAAEVLADGIRAIYDIKIPDFEGKTTYNVGIISGGTSVNTIIQEASMLCEYRSDNFEALEYMKNEFAKIFEMMKSRTDVTVKLVGERQTMKGVDKQKQKELTDYCVAVQEKHTGLKVKTESGSTDCNIPHSLGIPAVCVGEYLGGGAHTREEWLDKDSIPAGFEIVYEITARYFE